jgi:26S proteasome regulatory subunit N1
MIFIISYSQLNEHFLSLARDLDVAEVKSAEDIYKSHLADGSSARVRTGATAEGAKTGVDSAKQNLAESFVNAFVNAGHGKDSKLLTGAAGADNSDWLFKHKDTGVMSATAALGLVSLWDLDNGYSAIDKYMHSKNAAVQAGAVLATGMLSANVTSEMDAAIALLGEYLDNPNKDVRLAAILGY